MKVGILLGRFQGHYLHQGYEHLIDTIYQENDLIVFLLGTTVVKLCPEDALDFTIRREMISTYCINKKIKFEIFPLPDCKEDLAWLKNLDNLVKNIHGYDEVTLYGSRDSFIPFYENNNGKFPFKSIEGKPNFSSTKSRNSIVAKNSKDFRAGMIYMCKNRYPISYSTTDSAIFHDAPNGQDYLLLVKKPNEKAWRFPGGFVDPIDDNLESAAKREIEEETSIPPKNIERITYFKSYRVDDWRYRKGKDKIMTNLMVGFIKYGKDRISPADDVEFAEWFDVRTLKTIKIVEEHQQMFNDLLQVGYENLKKRYF